MYIERSHTKKMDWIECAANIGIACELVYATDKPPWAYNIKNAIKAATVVIADPAHKHLMISGLLSLVTYQLVNPTKTIHDCLVQFISAPTELDATANMLKILPAQLPVVTANIDAIEQMSAINREMVPIPDIVVEAHIRYQTAFKQYCIMVKQLLEQTFKNTEQYAINSAYKEMNKEHTAALPEEFEADIKGFIYFMMCFDPRNEFVPLYAPDKMSPDPAEIAMVRKLTMMKDASKRIAKKGVDEHSNDFGNTLQSFCVFVYKMSIQQPLDVVDIVPTIAPTEFTEDYGADSYLFGQYCSDYYALVSTLHVDHVKIAQKWWLQLIAVMYYNPTAFKNNRDDYMRTDIASTITRMNQPKYNPAISNDDSKNRTGMKLRRIGFLRARIYVAAGALAQLGSKTTLVDYVQSNIKSDDEWIQALSSGNTVVASGNTVVAHNTAIYKEIKIGDFVRTLVDIKRSLVIPDSKAHTCTDFSWCYKCQAIQRSQRELERFREFGIINTDDKRVLAQIKFEQQNKDNPMPVIQLINNTGRMVVLERRDMNSTDTDAFPS